MVFKVKVAKVIVFKVRVAKVHLDVFLMCTGLQRWIGGFGAYQAEIDAYDDDSVEGIMFNFECVEEGIESFKLRKYAN